MQDDTLTSVFFLFIFSYRDQRIGLWRLFNTVYLQYLQCARSIVTYPNDWTLLNSLLHDYCISKTVSNKHKYVVLYIYIYILYVLK